MGRTRHRKQGISERDHGWEPTCRLRETIRGLASRWSRDHRNFGEDFEQEALLSIWLKGEGNAPLNHQLQTARNRILSVRKLGKPVDRKLNANYKRAKTYLILSLEEKEGQLPSFLDLLPSPFLAEEYVVAKLTFLEILSYLEPEERRCALLR